MHRRVAEARRVDARQMRDAPPPAVRALPSGLGNQAMLRLLRAVAAREPAPSHLETQPVSDLYSGGTDRAQWGAQLRGGGSAVPLFAELATLLDATKLEDVAGTTERHINTALRPDPAELKPGLNFVARLGSRGLTGYLVNGEFTGTLPTTRDGPEPKVALMLGPLAFDAGNKAAALGVLRHEMEHAFHDRLAANLLRRWRQDATAAKTPFAGWLEKQAMSAVDRALVRERIPGTKVNTEALGHLEGFIAGFPVEAPDVQEGAHRVYENELKEAAHRWLAADKPVQAEFIQRLKALKTRLQGERQNTLIADLKDLKAGEPAYAALVDGVLR
jgi:hypothetical protein